MVGKLNTIDLSQYYTKSETNNLLGDKVDKVTGKGLSTNDYTDAEKRTKGWHQVSFVKKNTTNNSYVIDGGTDARKNQSNYYAIYIDGQFVYEEDNGTNRSYIYLYGYAGYDENHTAYFADGLVSPYTDVENLMLSESSGTYTINQTTYYGTREDITTSYKWQESNDGVAWTDISGETDQSYTPSTANGQQIRGGVQLTSSLLQTGYYYTSPIQVVS